jgi:AraC family transcriptional regulator of arabinose operon
MHGFNKNLYYFTYGVIKIDRSIQLIQPKENFSKVTCEQAWKWNTLEQPLPDFDLWYVWNGEGQLQLNREMHQLTKGSCFLFRPNDLTLAHHNPAKPLTVTYLHFTLESDPQQWFHPLPGSYRIVRDTFLFETYLNRYVEAGIERSYGHEQETRMLIALMLLHLVREEQAGSDMMSWTQDAALRDIVHLIRQLPSAPHSVTELAHRVQLSPRYFAIKFKEVIGETVEHFIIRTRIERAEHLLRYNGMNVTEVAKALGYRNIYFFSRQFKQYRGFSPSELRR